MQANTQSISVLKERHSVRVYKKGVPIPETDLNEIFQLASLAPSSWNLQHWKYVVIRDEEQKQKVLPIAYNQQQVVDCSAVVIVLGDLEANKNAEKVYGEAVQAGLMAENVKETLVNQIQNAYQTKENFSRDEAIRNASLGAMQLMLAAKAKSIDSCPIGGFDATALVELLRIPKRYIPVMMITLGYAAKPAHPTKRFPLSDILVHESF